MLHITFTLYKLMYSLHCPPPKSLERKAVLGVCTLTMSHKHAFKSKGSIIWTSRRVKQSHCISTMHFDGMQNIQISSSRDVPHTYACIYKISEKIYKKNPNCSNLYSEEWDTSNCQSREKLQYSHKNKTEPNKQHMHLLKGQGHSAVMPAVTGVHTSRFMLSAVTKALHLLQTPLNGALAQNSFVTHSSSTPLNWYLQPQQLWLDFNASSAGNSQYWWNNTALKQSFKTGKMMILRQHKGCLTQHLQKSTVFSLLMWFHYYMWTHFVKLIKVLKLGYREILYSLLLSPLLAASATQQSRPANVPAPGEHRITYSPTGDS